MTRAPFLFALALFALLPHAYASETVNCTPEHIKKPDGLDCDLRVAGKSDSCMRFSDVIKETEEKARKDLREFCDFVKKSQKAACKGGGQACEVVVKKKLSEEGAARLRKLITDLENAHNEIAKAREEIAREIVKKEDEVCKDSKKCEMAYPKYKDKPGARAHEKIDRKAAVRADREELLNLVRRKERKPSDITIRDKPEMEGSLLQRQAEIVNQMNRSQREVAEEIDHLTPRARELERQRDVADNSEKGLGPNGRPGGDQGKQDQAKKEGSPGGGSPGGGAPGGGDQGQPQDNASTLTDDKNPGDGTSPTPESKKQSQARSDDKDGNKKTGSTQGPMSIDPGKPGVASSATTGPSAAPYSPKGAASKSSSASSAQNGVRAALAASASSSGGGGSGGVGGSEGSEAKMPEAKGEKAAAASGASSSYDGGYSGGGGDDVLSPFGKPLSDPKFSLAGSETDESVRGMMEELGDEEGEEEDGRELASEESSDGIGERNGPSLFDRMRQFYDQCAQKSCVIAARRKAVGG